MPAFGLVNRNDLIRRLRQIGFQGPYSGGKHQFMFKGDLTIRVPNPNRAEIGRELLSRILRQAGITKEDWERL